MKNARRPLRILVVRAPFDRHHEWLFFGVFFAQPAARAAFVAVSADYDAPEALALAGVDLVILVRPRFPSVPRILAAAREHGARVLVMSDDNWLAAGRDHARFEDLFTTGKPPLEIFLAAARAADAVLVYSRAMEEEMRPHARRVVRLPGAVDLALFRRGVVPPARPFVVGYAGSPRFESAGFAGLARFLDADRQARLLLLAHEVPAELQALDQARIDFVPWQWRYDDYARALSAAAPDVLLAPLERSTFAASKVPFKLFDSAAVGAAGIYSRVLPYTEAIRDGIDGLLVENDPTAWEHAIAQLAADPARRSHLASNALERVRATAAVEVVLPQFLALVASVAGEGTPSAAPAKRGAPPRPLRVALLAHQAGIGSERVLLRLVRAFPPRAVAPVVVLAEEGPLRAELELAGVETEVLPLAWWIPATHWSAERFAQQLTGLDVRADGLARWLADRHVELVHTGFVVTLEGALAAARLGLPHVWHSRGLFGDGFPPAYLDDTAFFFAGIDALADTVVCVSRAVAAQAASACMRARVTVVTDGIDVDAFLARPLRPRAEVLASHGFAADARLVVALGGLQRRKGQRELVEAMAPLFARNRDLGLALAGARSDPSYVAELEARIAALGLADRVRLVGFEPDVRSLLGAAEVLAHPSLSEGFGLAIVEAMAAGLPVVATRCGGPEEVIVDGESGLLVPPADVGALSAALARTLGDAGLRARLGTAAASRARAFDLASSARETVAVYEEALSRHRSRDEGFYAERNRAGDRLKSELLARARAAAHLAPPTPSASHSDRPSTWLARLRARFAGSRP